jgi:hypothetical protein
LARKTGQIVGRGAPVAGARLPRSRPRDPQTAIPQPNRLDVERADCRQVSGAERWPNISAEQAFVAAVAFLPQTRFRRGLKPPIEIFIERDLHALHLAAEIAFAQPLLR